ncbi:sigma-E processing peptidase SpoIIGA [Acidaminobacterium chupaoyuni]
MRTIYLDVLFLNNMLVDYLLLLTTARFCGEICARMRMVCGALMGGAGAVFFFFEPFPLWAGIPLKIGFCFLICAVVFGLHPHGGLCRLALLFFLVTLCFAGVVFACGWFCSGSGFFYVKGGIAYLELPFWILLAACVIAYFLLGLAFGGGSMRRKEKDRKIECKLNGNEINFTAVIDTGNMLIDPAGGKRVIVADPELLRPLLPREDWLRFVKEGRAEEAFSLLMNRYQSGFSLVRFQTIEGKKRWMLCIRPDFLAIDGKENKRYLVGAAQGNLALPMGQCAVIGE